LLRPLFVASARSLLFASRISFSLLSSKSARMCIQVARSSGANPCRIRLPFLAVHIKRHGKQNCYSLLMVVFWVVMPSGLIGGYQCFGGTYCIHLQFPLKRWCPPTSTHGDATIHKTTIAIFIAVIPQSGSVMIHME
jgi:hypothetical protein